MMADIKKKLSEEDICDRHLTPAHRVGRLWKFEISKIDEWVYADGAGPDEEPRKGKE